MKRKKIRSKAKFYYYRMLCMLLNPGSDGLDPYDKTPLKRFFTEKIPQKKSAVRLLITGQINGVGYIGWLRRKAGVNNLKHWVFHRKDKTVEAVLIGSDVDINLVLKDAWKGPSRAKVAKIQEYWFKKPIKRVAREKTKKSQTDHFSWSQETASLFKQTIEYLDIKSQEPNQFEEISRVSNARELERAALNRNLFVMRLANVNYVYSPIRQMGLQNSLTSTVTSIIRSISDNKHLAKEVLSHHGLPVPKGDVFTEIIEAKEYLRKCNHPVVVKPVAGSYGLGITVDVRTEEALETAWEFAKEYGNQVIIEELVQGVDIRVLVVGGTACGALLRVPANVVGDGKSSVKSLIDVKNKERLKNPRLCKAPIVPDAYTSDFLVRQGHSMNSVPKTGEVVFLHLKANIAAGADSISIIEHIHPDLLRLAEEAASAYGVTDYWGIDLLVERIDMPRNRQQCNIIEVNSRANIYNVQFPMYGKPVDVAQALIDHLFPEGKKEAAALYPIEKLQARLSGNFDLSFFDWASESAKEFSVEGHVHLESPFAEVVVTGRRHKILYFLQRLWSWGSSDNGIIDGLQLYKTGTSRDTDTTPVSKGVFSLDNIPVMPCDVADCYQDKMLDINTQLFLAELNEHVYEAEYIYEELIKIRKDDKTGIIGMRYSSIFCDTVCEKINPAKKLLALQGLPVPRGAQFTTTQLSQARDYCSQFSKGILINMHPNSFITRKFKNKKKLKKLWKKAINMGTKNMLLEERVKGWHVCVAVVAGKAVGALAIEPLSVIGDGTSTIAQLIERKNAQREKNPWFCNKLVNIDERLLKKLDSFDLQLDSIIEAGCIVSLESEVTLHIGGETASITSLLHSDFHKKAVEAVEAIPGLEFAVVHMVIPDPDKPAENQYWVVSRIDTNPSVAEFHFPLKGEPCNIVKRVVEDLCLTERTIWI